MRCAKCGTTLPDDAAFCFHCGQPQTVMQEATPQAPALPAEPPPEPEYDVAVFKFIDRGYGICFEARLGKTLLASSPYSITSRKLANQDVKDKLEAQGWQVAERDEAGLVATMRRAKTDSPGHRAA